MTVTTNLSPEVVEDVRPMQSLPQLVLRNLLADEAERKNKTKERSLCLSSLNNCIRLDQVNSFER